MSTCLYPQINTCFCLCHFPNFHGICTCNNCNYKKHDSASHTTPLTDAELLKDRIVDLEDRMQKMENWKKIAKVLCDQSKKPHKCPLCDGLGEIRFYSFQDASRFGCRTDALGNFIKNCSACEGKGIVWG